MTVKSIVMVLALAPLAQAQEPLEATVRAALEKAVTFFRTEVSVQGSYLWRYSEDLSAREGENIATATMGWVQPPGTPTVGLAYLEAFQLTREPYLREAAIETGRALVLGQLRSGGWDYRIEFDPKARAGYAYRKPPATDYAFNVTTLDDDTTQAALRFLMRLDKELEFKDRDIHECVVYGLDALLAAQYPNGAWPQRFSAPPDPSQYPVTKASYPDSWSRESTKSQYVGYYTFNDNTVADTIEVMLDAWDCYGEQRYLDSALKAGDFIILAQMPDPQPAWAQQYDADMHPAWARKFEPPAITGHESQAIIRTLIALASRTGDKRFLEPIPRAIAYLRSSLLPDGRLARFYALHTNEPLYFTKDYRLTDDPSDMPTHYAFIVGSALDSLDEAYRSTAAGAAPSAAPSIAAANLATAAQAAVERQDECGAWVSDKPLRTRENPPADMKTISTEDFVNGVEALSRYIERLQGTGE